MTIHIFKITEVEGLDFRRFERKFGDWPNLPSGLVRDKLGSLVWRIDGYNNAPEELYHIPEVRRFYRELHRRWPWWLYFLQVSKEGMAIPYLCLLEQIDAVRVDGIPGTGASFEPAQLLEILRNDFPRMNQLFERAGIPDIENDRRTDAIIKLFCGSTRMEDKCQ